jgi:hypothetical protein
MNYTEQTEQVEQEEYVPPSPECRYRAALKNSYEKLSAHCHRTWSEDVNAKIDVRPYIVLFGDSYTDALNAMEATVEDHRGRFIEWLEIRNFLAKKQGKPASQVSWCDMLGEKDRRIMFGRPDEREDEKDNLAISPFGFFQEFFRRLFA